MLPTVHFVHTVAIAATAALLLCTQAAALMPLCENSGPDLSTDCENSWDRLWDIRWRVCSDPQSFGFEHGQQVDIFVQNDDCNGRGIFFGSDSRGRLQHCYRATRVILETCQLNNCQQPCFARGSATVGGEIYQVVRYLNAGLQPVGHPRQVTKMARRNVSSGHDAAVSRRH